MAAMHFEQFPNQAPAPGSASSCRLTPHGLPALHVNRCPRQDPEQKQQVLFRAAMYRCGAGSRDLRLRMTGPGEAGHPGSCLRTA